MLIPTFSFSTDSYSDQFQLVNLSGREAISEPYIFHLDLKSKIENSISIDDLVGENCTLSIRNTQSEGDEFCITGVLMGLEEVIRISAKHRFFKAIMAPALWHHKRSHSYDIYTNMTAPEVLEQEFQRNINLDYLMATTATYPSKEFFCQFEESNFNFVSRIAEHWGIYYYFNHDENGKIIFADDTNYDQIIPEPLKLDDSTNPSQTFQSIRTLRKTVNGIIKGVILTDCNPDQASQVIEAFAGETDDNNQVIKLVNQSCDDNEEAGFIADIRLQEFQSRKIIYTGTSGIPKLTPGFSINIDQGEAGTVELLVVEVEHQGANLDNAALAEDSSTVPYYECRFTAIPKDVPFRPKRTTQKPTAVSTTARTYSSENDQAIALRDERGRYKVVFDFLPPESDNAKKVATHWIRKAQIAAGTNHSDMPLVPNTEVKILFSGGNPDRPYIAGALENSQSDHVSVSNMNPHHAATITDGMLYSESAKSLKSLHITALENKNELQHEPYKLLDIDGLNTGEDVDEIAGKQHIHRLYGDRYELYNGNRYTYGKERSFHFDHLYEEFHANWKHVSEANNRFVIEKDMLYSDDQSRVENSDMEASKQVGMVHKSFGNHYDYKAGTVSTWAHGPDGEGIHKTFNYGGRYIENQAAIIKEPIDNFSGFPNEPNDDAYIEKTIGDKFNYLEGAFTGVYKGNETIEKEGNTKSTIKGDQETEITGNLTFKRKGNTNSEDDGDIVRDISGTIKQTINKDHEEKIGGNWKSDISGNTELKITGKYKENIQGKIEITGMAGAKITQRGTRETTVDNEKFKAMSANIDIKNKTEKNAMSQVKSNVMTTDSKMIDIKSKMTTHKGNIIMIG